jgi:ABC-2 type transport system ATP-binding protein
MSLNVQQVSKKYNSQLAVDAISFSINKGEIVGFLGPNGAGKSTTLKMIAGFLIPDSGMITINGVSVIEDPIAAKKLIGYLPESNALYEDLYVKEYLQFLGNIHQVKQLSNRIEKVVDQLGLGPMQQKKIGQLSKGYKQRVGIAAAILHEPALLLLDEPTSGLDPNQLIEIRNIIKSLSTNCMILFSTHILQEVTATCSSVLVLHEGKLVANEPIETLLKPITNNLRVSFEDNISALKDQMGDLSPFVISIDKHLLVLKLDANIDVKKKIMQFAIDKSLNIQRLQTEEASLEEIFKLLTH